MKKYLIYILGFLFFASTGVAHALPYYRSEQSILPFVNSTYYLGSTSPDLRWKAIYADQICLTADICRTILTGGAGGSGGGTWATTTSQVSGRLINYPLNTTDIPCIGGIATTTCKTWFDPTTNLNQFNGIVSIGNSVAPQLTGYGTGYYQLHYSTSTNDIGGADLYNINTGTQAAVGIFLQNNKSNLGGIGLLQHYYGGLIYSGGNWDGPSQGLGALPASSLGLFTVDGKVVIGSATSTGEIDFYTGGNSFSGGIPDAFINNLGQFSVATATPWGQISASSTSIYPTLVVEQKSTGSAAIFMGGNVGIGTSSPGTVLSVANTNFTTATTTSNATGGINIKSGCFAINGTCVSGSSAGGSGTVTSVTLATPNSSLSLGGTNPITTSGTINVDLNYAKSNFWTALQNFTNATTSTFGATSTVYFTGVGSAGGLAVDGNGKVYSGATSTLTTISGILPVASGGTGNTTFTGGNLLYGNGTGSVGSVATTTVSCTGSTSCTQFVTIGGSPITITGVGNAFPTSTNPLMATFFVSTSTSASSTFAGPIAGTKISGTSGAFTNLVSCDTIDTDAYGNMSCGTDTSGSGAGTYPFTPTTNYGANTNATSGIVWFQNGLQASSTSQFDNASTSQISARQIYDSALTLGRLTFATSSGQLMDSSLITYNTGTSLFRVGTSIIGLSVNAGTGATQIGTDSGLTAYDLDSNTFFQVTGNRQNKTFTGQIGPIVNSPSITLNQANGRINVNTNVTGGSYFNIGTTTNTFNLVTLASTTAPQISLSSGAGFSEWVHRAVNGNIYLATTSSSGTYATSSLAAMTILQNGGFGVATNTPGTLFSVGNINGVNFTSGTSTFNTTGGIDLKSGCFSINGSCITGGSSTGASTTLLVDSNTWTGANNVFTGNLAVATATPGTPLSVTGSGVFTGQVEALNFYATSTTATSTFLGKIDTNRLTSATARVTGLVSCDTVDTDAYGNFACGTDSTGAGGSITGNGITGMMAAWSSGSNIIATSTIIGERFVATSTTAASSSLPNLNTTNLSVTGNAEIGVPRYGWLANMLLSVDSTGLTEATSTPTAGAFFATSTTASSTLQGLSINALNIRSTTATSTAANGFNLTGGCYAINGSCITGGVGGGSGASTTLLADSNTWTGARNTFTRNLSVGNTVAPQLTGFGTGNYDIHFSTSSNDVTGMDMYNINSGTSAAVGIFMQNGASPLNGIGLLQTYYGGMIFSGHGWNGAANGVGALPADSLGVYSTDGALVLGSATSTGRIDFITGPSSFSSGVMDMTLLNNGNLGIGTSTPSARLSVTGATASTNNVFAISTSTISATSTAIVINSNGFLGIGSSTPYAPLSIGNAGGINIGPATSTFNGVNGGINIKSGCYAINGSCLTGGGSFSGATSTLLADSNTFTGATTTFTQDMRIGNNAVQVNSITGTTSISSLERGNDYFDVDAGMTSWVDLPLLAAASGTPQGYTASVNGSSTLTVMGLAGPAGWMQLNYPRVGIATTSPFKTFSVNGTVAISGLTTSTAGNSVCILAGGEVVTAGGTTCVTSNSKTKNSITDLSSSEVDRIIKSLNPVSFIYNESRQERVGFIAEEVAKIDPRLVDFANKDIDFPNSSGVIKKGEALSVEYGNITALLVKKIQNLEVGKVARSAEENWQWIFIGILGLGLIYQQRQINKLKK